MVSMCAKWRSNAVLESLWNTMMHRLRNAVLESPSTRRMDLRFYKHSMTCKGSLKLFLKNATSFCKKAIGALTQ